MKNSKKVVALLLSASMALSLLLSTGCARHPNEEQIRVLEETRAAALAAEKQLEEKRQERMKLEKQLEEKKQMLEKAKKERDEVKKRIEATKSE
ncbi:MAG: hypothetical protein GXO78_01490 [Calditrichaeota bacterium]|nr:hypothetical protein [Calditrichota bacterium]